jgi:uncharacterized protein with PIN domain
MQKQDEGSKLPQPKPTEKPAKIPSEEEKPPAESELKKRIHHFYDKYIGANPAMSKAQTENEVGNLRDWLNQYATNVKGGKTDIKFNMKPPVLRQVCFDTHAKFFNSWRSFPQKWQLLLEVLEKFQIHTVLIITVFQSIEMFKEYLSGEGGKEVDELKKMLHDIGGQGWWCMPISFIEKYVSTFNVVPLSRKEDANLVQSEIKRLMSQKNDSDAAVMIQAFDLYSSFDCEQLVERLARLANADNQKKNQQSKGESGKNEGMGMVDRAIEFVKNNATLGRILINSLYANAYSSQARVLIKKFDFDPYDFPHVIDAQRFLAIRSLVKRLGWMIAEEVVSSEIDKNKALGTLVDVLVRDNLIGEALSVAQRNSLTLSRKTQDELARKGKVNPVPNTLLTKDDFCPTEVYLEGKKLDDYLTLATFGIKENDVIFLNKVDERFHDTCEKLLSSRVVGVDSEFSSDLLGYTQSKIAILQIASDKLTVIYDFLAFGNSDPLYEFCKKLFESETIKKIGHTFVSDIKCLRATFGDRPMSFAAVVSIDDVFLFEDSNQKFGLAQIVKRIYGKEFSKYNQQSNWKKRPLRRSQIHYAALDAVATLHLYLKIEKEKGTFFANVKEVSFSANPQEGEAKGKKVELVQNEDLLKKYIEQKHFKFIVDGMLKKLAHNLRNIGLDAVFAEESMKPSEIIKQADLEERIILTRDRKLINCKKDQPLIKIISTNPFAQLKQLIDQLKIRVTKGSLLSRCVKCNGDKLVEITAKEAMEELKWENQEESKVKEFYQCTNCKQIYWEGGTWDRAQKMFAKLINYPELGHQASTVLDEEKSSGEEEDAEEFDEPIEKKIVRQIENESREGMDVETIIEKVAEEVEKMEETKKL